jgi:hypothetical protein
MALKLGYFRFCYEYKLHFDPFVSPSGNSSAQDAKVSGCQTIAHKCEFNLVWACTHERKEMRSCHTVLRCWNRRSRALCAPLNSLHSFVALLHCVHCVR